MVILFVFFLRSHENTSLESLFIAQKNLSEVFIENRAEKNPTLSVVNLHKKKNKGRTEKSSLLFPPHMFPLNLTQDLTKNPI